MNIYMFLRFALVLQVHSHLRPRMKSWKFVCNIVQVVQE